ncbi:MULTISPECIES: hypothetical protein [unclassified Actinoplanes]|uniref:hypothetical protein n=1 Tax=unclassified Actinoplanes TaxID=2626549 RepID=UPI0012BACC3F|nr:MULTISPECIES: hypothetical protein [unclassified Actinoplanes]
MDGLSAAMFPRGRGMPLRKADAEALRGIGRDVAKAATTLQEAAKAVGSGLVPAPRHGRNCLIANRERDSHRACRGNECGREHFSCSGNPLQGGGRRNLLSLFSFATAGWSVPEEIVRASN